jgi:predicted DNA-binding protein with PD1-like motif
VADAGDDALAVLSDFANVNQIDAAQFRAVGAFQDYRAIEVDEPSEVLSLLGDISLGAGGPEVRARVVLGLADGTTRGGHLLASTIWPTLEVTLRETAGEPREWIEALGANRPDHGIALVPSRSAEPALAGSAAPTAVAASEPVAQPEPVAAVAATVRRGPGLRSRSAAIICGLALILLGAWGALAPFIGPSFDFGFSPDGTWQWTSARGWLEVLPGCVAAVGGLVMMISPNRLIVSLGGSLAALAGGWFIAGPSLADLLKIGSPGTPLGSRPGIQSLESLALFYGLGAVIVLLVAFVVGRVSARAFAPAPLKPVRPTAIPTAAAVRSEPVHEQRWEPTAVAAH